MRLLLILWGGLLTLIPAYAQFGITPPPFLTAGADRPARFIFRLNGSGPAPFVWSATGSVPGLAFSHPSSSFGPLTSEYHLAGTPTTPGSYPVTVTLRDGGGAQVSVSVVIQIFRLGVLTTVLPDGEEGMPYEATIRYSPGAPPMTAETCTPSATFPGFTCVKQSGTEFLLRGRLGTVATPVESRTYNCFVQVYLRDATPIDGIVCIPLTVRRGLSIVDTIIPQARQGQPYSHQLRAERGRPPYVFSALSPLPAGITLSSSGLISGTPTGSGSSTLRVGITDANQTQGNGAALAFVVNSTTPSVSLRITTLALPDATQGQPYTLQATATGNDGSVRWSAIGLPAGLTITVGGLISGTATAPPGVYTVKLGAGDNKGIDSVDLLLRVNAPGSAPPGNPPTGPTNPPDTPCSATKVTLASPPPGNLDPGILGKLFQLTFEARDGCPPYRFEAAILTLPPGMTVTSDGAYVGTPTKAGEYTFEVKVTDSKGNTDTKTYTHVVFDAPRLTSTPPNGEVNQPYRHQLTFAGGSPPYRIRLVSGPSWLSFNPNTLFLTGTPTEAGKVNVVLEITDANDKKVTETISITVDPAPGPLKITSTSPLPDAVLNQTYSHSFKAEGGKGPYTWAIVGNAIPGLSLNPGTGVLSGQPVLTAKHTITVKVSDSTGATDQKTFELTVLAPAQISVSPSTVSMTLFNDGTPVQTFLNIVNGTGKETVQAAGEGGAPVLITTSALQTIVQLAASAPATVAPGTYQNRVTIVGTGGLPVVVAVTIRVLLAQAIQTALLSPLVHPTVTGAKVEIKETLLKDEQRTKVCLPPGTTVETPGGEPATGAGNCWQFKTFAEAVFMVQTLNVTRRFVYELRLPGVPYTGCSAEDLRAWLGGLQYEVETYNQEETPAKVLDGEKTENLPARARQVLKKGIRGETYQEIDPPKEIIVQPQNKPPSSCLEYADRQLVPSVRKSADGTPNYADACTANKLFVLRGVQHPIAARQGRPVWLRAVVYDNCGQPKTSATVWAQFTNGDAPLPLAHGADGIYSAFWTPIRGGEGQQTVVVRVQADGMSASTAMGVEIQPDPAALLLERGGVVSGASFEGGRNRAPGEFVSLFGANLAPRTARAESLPLPATLEGIRVELNGQPLPLLFVSPGQINAILPFGLPDSPLLQLAVRRDGQPPYFVDLLTGAAQPAVFSRDLSGKGQGIILDPQFRFYDAANAAKAGDPFVIYLSGLGEVDPPVPAGSAAPTTTLHRARLPVRVTIGGVEAPVAFAGLAPGLVGVYQLNGTVPAGVAPGDAVPVVVSAGGQSSPAVTMAVR